MTMVMVMVEVMVMQVMMLILVEVMVIVVMVVVTREKTTRFPKRLDRQACYLRESCLFKEFLQLFTLTYCWTQEAHAPAQLHLFKFISHISCLLSHVFCLSSPVSCLGGFSQSNSILNFF